MIEFRVGGGLKGEKKIGGLLRRSIDSGNLNVIWVGIIKVEKMTEKTEEEEEEEEVVW